MSSANSSDDKEISVLIPLDDDSQHDMEFKVVLIGDGFTGKTSIINRFLCDSFASCQPPTIAASYIPFCTTCNGKKVRLNIWDTAGHEKYHCLVPLYTRASDAIIVVFDLSLPETFENAKVWYEKILEEVGAIPVVVICGNKLDLNPDADVSEYKKVADENNALFITTSALNGTNIKQLFSLTTKKLVEIELEKEKHVESPKLVESKNSGCC